MPTPDKVLKNYCCFSYEHFFLLPYLLCPFTWWFWLTLVAQTVKHLPARWETQVHPLEKAVATHSSILTWRIPEEPGRLQSTGWQRVRHD